MLFLCRERPKLLLDNVTGEPTMLYNGVQFGSGSKQLVFTIGAAEQILFGGPKFELLKPLNLSGQAQDKHTQSKPNRRQLCFPQRRRCDQATSPDRSEAAWPGSAPTTAQRGTAG